jgi:hypothetical protein
VELAPAVFPSRLNLGADGGREGAEDARARVAVGGELDLVSALDLLEAVGRELDEACARLLGLRERDADRGSDQRNALFSFSKKPSSGR